MENIVKKILTIFMLFSLATAFAEEVLTCKIISLSKKGDIIRVHQNLDDEHFNDRNRTFDYNFEFTLETENESDDLFKASSNSKHQPFAMQMGKEFQYSIGLTSDHNEFAIFQLSSKIDKRKRFKAQLIRGRYLGSQDGVPSVKINWNDSLSCIKKR